jgi:hypothetical protein
MGVRTWFRSRSVTVEAVSLGMAFFGLLVILINHLAH